VQRSHLQTKRGIVLKVPEVIPEGYVRSGKRYDSELVDTGVGESKSL
jgi:hypothetical protein